MDKIQCDTCGGSGFPDLIATCSKCNSPSEHLYCMKKFAFDVPEGWICESCSVDDVVAEENDGHITSLGGQNKIDQEGHACYKWKRPRRVKFITKEEVVKLSLGATKSGVFSKSSSMPKRTSIRYRTVTEVYSPTKKKKENASPLNLEQRKCPAYSGIQIKSVSSNQQPLQTLKESKGSRSISDKKAPLTPSTLHPRQKQLTVVLISGKASETREKFVENTVKTTSHEISTTGNHSPICCSENVFETPEKLIDDTMKKISCDPSTTGNSLPINKSGSEKYAVAEDRQSIDEERELANLLPYIDLYRPYLPALHATWKGGFLFLDTDTASQFYGGFQAQPPCKVKRKAYEFSHKLPPVLKVKLLPQPQLLVDLFQNECPDLCDIALYFIPSSNIERSRQNNCWLFDLMENQNSMLSCYIEDGELLIFTSKQLHADSQYVMTALSTECSLLGIFRHVKNHQSPLEDANIDRERKNDSDTVDMEIDMLGGYDVGIVDIVSPRSPCENNLKGNSEKSLQIVDAMSATIPSSLNSTNYKQLLEVKPEPIEPELPPGFTKKVGVSFSLPLRSSFGTPSTAPKNMDAPPGFEKRPWKTEKEAARIDNIPTSQPFQHHGEAPFFNLSSSLPNNTKSRRVMDKYLFPTAVSTEHHKSSSMVDCSQSTTCLYHELVKSNKLDFL